MMLAKAVAIALFVLPGKGAVVAQDATWPPTLRGDLAALQKIRPAG